MTELTAGGVAAVVAAVLAVARTARSVLGGEGTSGRSMLRGLLARVWRETKGVVLPWTAVALVVIVVLVLLLRWSAALVAARRPSPPGTSRLPSWSPCSPSACSPTRT